MTSAISAPLALASATLLETSFAALLSSVFSVFFGEASGLQDFSVNILAGILPWLIFQDVLGKSSLLIASHSNLVKQIVFPVTVIPVKAVIASSIPYFFGIVFLFFYSGFNGSL